MSVEAKAAFDADWDAKAEARVALIAGFKLAIDYDNMVACDRDC